MIEHSLLCACNKLDNTFFSPKKKNKFGDVNFDNNELLDEEENRSIKRMKQIAYCWVGLNLKF